MFSLLRALVALFLFAAPAVAMAQTPAASETAPIGVDDLVRLLEDEAARNALIERLKNAVPTDGADQAARAAEHTSDPTVARQIAEYTRAIAEGASSSIAAVIALSRDVAHAFAGSATLDYSRLLRVGTEIMVLAGALFAGHILLRSATGFVERATVGAARRETWIGRGLGLLVSLAFRLGAVLAAWAVGYCVSLFLLGGPGNRMAIAQPLLLNAFLVVETCKVALGVVFQPNTPGLRVIRMSDTTAAYWYFWTARIVGLVGYAFMFFAPVLAEAVSAGAAQAMRVVVMLTVLAIGILIVLQNKTVVRDAMMRRVNKGHQDALARTLAFIGTYWHVLAITYLFAVFILWFADPREALPFVIGATIQSIIAVAVGLLVMSFISRFIRAGVWLPDDVKQRLPLLEARLHAFVPRVMQVVRTVILIGIVISIAQAWGLIDFVGWAASETGQRLTGSVVSALVILLVGLVIYLAVSSWVEYRLNPNFGTVPTARERTLLSLFRNAFTIALFIFIVMLALAQIGINIAPLLAGAGVLGLAIGFGAQKFVQDIITGVFIQLENIMNEGDVVEAGGKSGVVETLTIRSVSIRSLDGTLHLIPFSSVDMVSNSMKGFSYHLAEIRVAYHSCPSSEHLAQMAT